jgi:hypothetical protein
MIPSNTFRRLRLLPLFDARFSKPKAVIRRSFSQGDQAVLQGRQRAKPYASDVDRRQFDGTRPAWTAGSLMIPSNTF